MKNHKSVDLPRNAGGELHRQKSAENNESCHICPINLTSLRQQFFTNNFPLSFPLFLRSKKCFLLSNNRHYPSIDSTLFRIHLYNPKLNSVHSSQFYPFFFCHDSLFLRNTPNVSFNVHRNGLGCATESCVSPLSAHTTQVEFSGALTTIPICPFPRGKYHRGEDFRGYSI